MSLMDLINKVMDKPADGREKMNNEEICRYRNMITNAERHHKKMFVKAYAERYLGYLEGKLAGKEYSPPGEEFDPSKAYRIFCNEFFVNSEVLKPNLYFQTPHAVLESKQEKIERVIEIPRSDLNGQPILDEAGQPVMEQSIQNIDGAGAAELLENIVNEILASESVKWKDVAKKAVATMIPLNFAVSKWGWKTEVSGETMNMQLNADEPVCEWFNPLNFLVDPECTRIDLKDAKYVIFRFIKPTEIIKKSGLYKGVDDLKGSSELKFSGDKNDPAFISEYWGKGLDLERNTLWEIWDIVNKKVVTFVDDKDFPIRNVDWLWKIKGYPCKILACGESLTGFYPVPDFRAYESLVMTKTLLVQKLTNLLLRLNKSFIYDKTAIKDRDTVQRIMDIGEAGVVGVDNPEKRDIDQFLKNLNDFKYSDSYNDFIRIIDVNLERLSGLADFQRGLITQAKRTATELINLQSSQNLRIEFKKDAIVTWMEENVHLLIELLQANADSPRVQKLVRDNTTFWMPWDKTHIQGKYAVSVDMGDMVKQNIEVKRKQAMEAYQLFSQNPLVDQVENTKEALKAEGVKDPDKRMNQAEVEMYNNKSQVMPGGQAPAEQGPTMTEAATGQIPAPNMPVDIAKEAAVA